MYLALTQALIATGFQLIPSLGGLIMLRFTSVLALITMTLSIGRITGPLMSYPAGYLADRRGRKAVLFLGMGLCGVGSLLIYSSIMTSFLVGFIAGLVFYGLGLGALVQITVAALDMYPKRLKAEGMGYVMTGTSLGSIGSPLLVWTASNVAATYGLDELAIPWLAPPVLMVVTAMMVSRIIPDPLEIARNIGDYYSGEPVVMKKQVPIDVKVSNLLRTFPVQVALVNNALGFAVMLMVMSLSALMLRQNGYSITLISACIGLHVFGMFGFSSVFGRMADRMGRKKMMYVGSIVLGISGLLSPLTANYWIITIGLFLVGLGWSANNVATTAMFGDSTPPTSMGRMMGVNQLIGGASSLFLPAIGGYLAQNFGFPSVGVVSMLLSVPILLLAFRLKELTPGNYNHS
ncbi:MAG: MFS transporter [Promethearchaeota archaeon]